MDIDDIHQLQEDIPEEITLVVGSFEISATPAKMISDHGVDPETVAAEVKRIGKAQALSTESLNPSDLMEQGFSIEEIGEVGETIAKKKIQGAIAQRYGAGDDVTAENLASAALSVSGKIGDATSLLIDQMVQDILAVESSKDSPYSLRRIELFEELHKEGSWAAAVDFATTWHNGRKSGDIPMPFDDKGIQEIIQESAQLGGFVKMVIAQIQSAMNPNQE